MLCDFLLEVPVGIQTVAIEAFEEYITLVGVLS